MMLALDTSASPLLIALWDMERDSLAAELLLDNAKTHGSLLLPALQWLTSHWPDKKLRAVAVCVGPGSFTGLRVGVASAIGLAYAWNLPMISLSSLELPALSHGPVAGATVWVINDARQHMVYAAPFQWEGDKLLRLAPDGAASPERLRQLLAPPALLLGSGAALYGETLTGEGIILGNTDMTPRPGLLARQAACYWREGVTVSPWQIKPNYCRPSDAEKRFTLPLEEYSLL
ncbi:MAG: tRNA (adenosine(37)-N6)-threonylcarbamoyltransferase complex dimerization subunit type 1 TsaB [Desulfarculales bacterium]|jgi:tRNA threonylcarbamoyladenosine biosynthesis protein TsaB|nr:tRNA (adenosine(37)-N6)-threonylcarbamoyltransferase complex dimerization subunit type 1 TsaB [Desulfarculales bacterium]